MTLLEDVNRDTQPLPRHRLFANWSAVSRGWFVLCRSGELAAGAARSFTVCGHRVVAWRGRDGRARAMDAFCPHMGLDLGRGDVIGNDLRCAFHHWVFGEDGRPRGGPPSRREDPGLCLPTWATWEGYGLVWIYPDAAAPAPPYLPPELDGAEVVGSPMAPQHRACHPHAATSNGVDIHHVRAVHGLDLAIDAEIRELAPNVLRFDFRCELPGRTWSQRLVRALLGPRYGYSVTYVDGTLGIFHSLIGVRLLGLLPVPEAFMILAPRWTEVGAVQVFPVALAARARGVGGWLRTRVMLLVAKAIYAGVVAGEGTEFFRHLRYRVDHLEPGADDTVARLVEFFDRQEISAWGGGEEGRPC